MRGSIIKRGSTYTVVVDVGRGPDGKRVRRWHSGYRTRRAAELARTRILHAIDQGTYKEPTKVTLGEYLDGWLERLDVKDSTKSLYRTNITAYIVPSIGHVQVAKLTRDQFTDFYRELERSGRKRGGGLSKRSVRIVHVIIRRALQDAVKSDLLPRNVAALADSPRLGHHEADCWTPEQLGRFLDTTSHDRLAALWQLIASTGMRRGEVLGLRWSDLDLDAGRLTINQTVVNVDNRPTISPTPKTKAGRRTLALDADTVVALRRHRARQAEERLACGTAWRETGLVFTMEDGGLIRPALLSRRFTAAVRRAGLPPLGIHGLRHSYITMLLRDGVPLRVVAERAGHSSANVTSAVYSHVLPGDDEDAAERGAALLRAGGLQSGCIKDVGPACPDDSTSDRDHFG
jgi:integrase